MHLQPCRPRPRPRRAFTALISTRASPCPPRHWKAAGVDAPAGNWAGDKGWGCGMGLALTIAAQSGANVLTDPLSFPTAVQ